MPTARGAGMPGKMNVQRPNWYGAEGLGIHLRCDRSCTGSAGMLRVRHGLLACRKWFLVLRAQGPLRTQPSVLALTSIS